MAGGGRRNRLWRKACECESSTESSSIFNLWYFNYEIWSFLYPQQNVESSRFTSLAKHTPDEKPVNERYLAAARKNCVFSRDISNIRHSLRPTANESVYTRERKCFLKTISCDCARLCTHIRVQKWGGRRVKWPSLKRSNFSISQRIFPVRTFQFFFPLSTESWSIYMRNDAEWRKTWEMKGPSEEAFACHNSQHTRQWILNSTHCQSEVFSHYFSQHLIHQRHHIVTCGEMNFCLLKESRIWGNASSDNKLIVRCAFGKMWWRNDETSSDDGRNVKKSPSTEGERVMCTWRRSELCCFGGCRKFHWKVFFMNFEWKLIFAVLFPLFICVYRRENVCI